MHHKTNTSTAVLAAAFSLTLGGALTAQAAPKAKKPNGWGAIQKAEKLGGKKLTASQKATITKAAIARDKSIGAAHKAAWDKFWVTVSSTAKVPVAKLKPAPKKKA